MKKRSGLIGLVLLPTLAAAHPLHKPGSHYGLSHYLLDPYHLGTLTLIALAAWMVWRWARRTGMHSEKEQ
ncbi:MAG: hypothetical protein D6715_02160 [Calditrichaeota bacterium]|nr:MAG: hypothetical protein D6715_02160 [Calditrichota bacterium]